MKSILKKQAELQAAYAKLPHYSLMDPSKSVDKSVGEVYNYVQTMQFFLNQEIDELLLELSNGDRAIHKPWSSRYKGLRDTLFVSSAGAKSEAIDILCFCLNILLSAGITHENIEAEYDKVLSKNTGRQKDATY